MSPTGDTTIDTSNGSGNLTGQTDGPIEVSRILVVVDESLKVADKITVKADDVVGSKSLGNGGELAKDGGKRACCGKKACCVM
jgi:hypothetical protein